MSPLPVNDYANKIDLPLFHFLSFSLHSLIARPDRISPLPWPHRMILNVLNNVPAYFSKFSFA